MDAEKHKIIFDLKCFAVKDLAIFKNYCVIFIWKYKISAIIFVPVL
jgi:hypothetical protein